MCPLPGRAATPIRDEHRQISSSITERGSRIVITLHLLRQTQSEIIINLWRLMKSYWVISNGWVSPGYDAKWILNRTFPL